MDVLAHPNPSLKMRADEVDPTSEENLKDLCRQMARAMYEAPGIGLAATQVGVMKRVVIYDLDDGLIALCNPVLVEHGEETAVDDEGCLSLPGIVVPVERATEVTCEAVTLEGTPVRFRAADLHARVLQHEIDHLDGLLIIDRATPEERKAALRRYLDVQQGIVPPDDSVEI